MSFKEVISVKGFWKSVFYLAIAFIVIYNLINIGFSYGFNFDAFAEEKFAGTGLVRFIVANLISGFIYGFIVVFLQFRGKLKREQKER